MSAILLSISADSLTSTNKKPFEIKKFFKVKASIFNNLLLKDVPLKVKEKFEGLWRSNGINSLFLIDSLPDIFTDLILIKSP